MIMECNPLHFKHTERKDKKPREIDGPASDNIRRLNGNLQPRESISECTYVLVRSTPYIQHRDMYVFRQEDYSKTAVVYQEAAESCIGKYGVLRTP